MTTTNSVRNTGSPFDLDRSVLNGTNSQYYESKAKYWLYSTITSEKNICEPHSIKLKVLGPVVGIASGALSILRRVALIAEELFLAVKALVTLNPLNSMNHVIKSLYHVVALPVVIVSASANAIYKTIYFLLDPIECSMDRYKHHRDVLSQFDPS